jgi:hypothetical protein
VNRFPSGSGFASGQFLYQLVSISQKNTTDWRKKNSDHHILWFSPKPTQAQTGPIFTSFMFRELEKQASESARDKSSAGGIVGAWKS